MTALFFIYGLAFFTLGATIAIYPKKHSKFRLAKNVWLIATFAILHGLNEWADMFIIIHKPLEMYSLQIIKALLLPLSFAFLVQFGTKSLIEGKSGYRYRVLRALPFVFFIIWAVVVLNSMQRFLMAEIWARYLLGIPGILLTSYTLMAQSTKAAQFGSRARNYFRLSALFFFFYCFFSGLIVPDAGFFPASVLNYTVCAENIGLYVQVFRTLCALVIAFGMIKVLQVFEVETIDELKKAYGELENRTSELGLANALLHQTNRELEAFTYSVSHDLRAPLRIINGFSEMVLESYGQRLDEKGRSLLNMIRSNVNRMDGLILALLALSKVTRQEMKIGELDLGRLAKEVFSELRTTESGHAIHFDIKALPTVNADLLLMRQVFTNLLSNAIKFSSMKNSAEIEVGGSSEGSENIYYVKDNGAGFDMEYADKLFGVFQRLHSSREFEGTGIGLSIVRRIIQRHGGRVWAEGKPNEGAIFYFSLPRGESHS